jgi:ribosomal protein S18 acetylase RimI-like enzyme
VHPGVTLRPVAAGDEPFLFRLYASTRAEELAIAPWDDAAKENFLRFQFHAQSVHYQKHYPDASRQVILSDGVPSGRLYVDRSADEILIIDIALLPEYRGAGVGSALLRGILEEAAGRGVPVRIHVEVNNPALRLYRRLGFREAGNTGVYFEMEWTPPGGTGS